MITTENGFTQDVKVLLAVGDKGDRLRIMRQVPDDKRAQFIARGVVEALSEFMRRDDTPAFVSQVVGRALAEQVDWDAVSRWSVIDPEEN